MNDEDLLAVLRDVLGADDGAPDRAAGAARSAFRWVDADSELAELVTDSADAPALAGMRGPAPRQLTWRYADLVIECEVGADLLLAQVDPPAGLELCSPDGGVRALAVDEHGRCQARPPTGPFSLRARRAGQPDVLTPWLVAS
jgi:hypothetical protein